jgi:hypothetical protein
MIYCKYYHEYPEGTEWTGVFASGLVHAGEERSGMFATNGIYGAVTDILHKSM